MRSLCVAVFVAIPGMAAAAPFCVAVQGLSDECLYADPASCQTRASQLGGACVSNPAESLQAVGPGRFCLVIGGQASQCIYPDRGSCTADAVRHRTACVEVTGNPGTSEIDPFALRRPY